MGCVDARYQNWNDGLGQDITNGNHDLSSLAELVESSNLDPAPVSGQQEFLEIEVNRAIEAIR